MFRGKVVVALMLLPLLAAANTSWPEGPTHAYVDRCAKSMSAQGLPLKIAKSYCSCAAEGMSKEFGVEEYDQMMKAQPSKHGSDYDQRLYKVISACGSILPH